MVLRKPTSAGGGLPYPVTPTSPQPALEMASLQNTHPDAFPSSHHQSFTLDTQPHDDGDRANPWADAADEELHIKRSLPTVLRAGSAPRSTEELPTDKGLPHRPHWGEGNTMTPRSSSDSQRSMDFWDVEEFDHAETEALSENESSRHDKALRVPDAIRKHNGGQSPTGSSSPGFSTVRRKPVPASEYPQPSPGARSLSYDFASNNPFRQKMPINGSPQQEEHTQEALEDWSGHSNEHDVSEWKGKGVVRDPPTNETPIQMTANLSLEDRPFEEYSPSYRPSNISLNGAYRSREESAHVPPTSTPPYPSSPPPPPPSSNEPADLIPVTPSSHPGQNPWSLETSIQPPPQVITEHQELKPDYGQDEDLYEGQEMGIVTRGDSYQQLAAVNESPFPPFHEGQLHDETGPPLPARPPQRSLLDEPRPSLPPRPAQKSLLDDPIESYAPPDHPPPGHAPPKPPRPILQSTSMNEASLQKMKEQRNETYQIKHFNWFDHNTNSLRRSSMLTQNKNGPCPLLALVNALILSKPDDTESALGNALRAREQVSLGLLIESLMDELTSESRDGPLGELPDVDELNGFLLRLHSGMNANPRFVAPEVPAPNLMDARNSMLHVPLSINTDRKPGTFEQTQDLVLYGAFAIPLVHGWLPQRSDPARAAFARAAPTYEDAQTIQFGEEELEIKLGRGGLTPSEQQLWEDIVSIRRFFGTYPTQLTPYGLDIVSESLFPGAFAIMFRNDHFSTVYKHPETGQLYTLVTDAGYADKDEVIWESLVDVSGQHSEFFSGDFRPVGNVAETIDPLSQASGLEVSSSHLNKPPHTAPPISPQETQAQHDADFAMALQLQEEEQARQANPNPRRRAAHNRGSSAGENPRPSSIPIRLHPADAGPAVPPRNQRSNPGVNRPSSNDNAADDDAPPLYEEAVKGAPYIPPPGHPQHPASDPSPRASASAITPTAPGSGLAPRPLRERTPTQPARAPQQHQRRMSAYHEAQQYQRPEVARPLSHNAGMGLQGQPVGRRPQKDQDKDCIVM
jgi:ubiquitin carboxyl-terminal hydrolase MINDY-1/2